MAELPNRDQLESDFSRTFGKIARRHMIEFRELLGDPPDLANVPQEFWDKLERESRHSLYWLFLLIFGESAALHGWTGPAAKLATSGWAHQQAETIAHKWTTRTQAMLAKLFAQTAKQTIESRKPEPVAVGGGLTVEQKPEPYERGLSGLDELENVIEQSRLDGLSAPDLMNYAKDLFDRIGWTPTKDELAGILRRVFGPERVTTYAIDGTTAAQYWGGEAGIEATVGISADDLWICETNEDGEPDERVCPKCFPLHMLHRRDWPAIAKNGAPLHSRCRCSVRYSNQNRYKSLWQVKGWITLKPHGDESEGYAHVFIDESTGKISAGPEAMVGKKPHELSTHKPLTSIGDKPKNSEAAWNSLGSKHEPTKNDRYVLRRTVDPEADLRRGWSAWGGQYDDNPLDNPEVDNAMQSAGKDVYDVINAIDDENTKETDDGWEIKNTSAAMAQVAEWIRDNLDLDIQKDPKTGKYGLRHHEGLSAYEIDADDPEDAVHHARKLVASGRQDYLTGGVTGVHPVSYYHLGGDKYIFRVRSIEAQHDS